MFIVMFAIGAFVEADFRTKTIAGNHDAAIFSYTKHENNKAEFTAFGESITINLDKLDSAIDKLGEISEVNRSYAPSFIILSGEILNGSLSGVSEGLSRIPDIISYFYNPGSHRD
jgi:hypothetical protein